MKTLMMKVACATALAASAIVVPAVTGLSAADAATACTHDSAYLTETVSSTTQVAATNTCANEWSVQAASFAEHVTGEFKNSAGKWTASSAGPKWTKTTKNAQKIVLALNPGEPLRAIGDGGSEDVLLWF